jgi:hypothetical protein
VRLDEAAFALLERTRQFKGQTLEIAKRRLLDGENVRELAAAYGVNPQRVYSIERQVTAAWEEIRPPDDWVQATFFAPVKLIEQFQQQVKEARAKHVSSPVPRSRSKRGADKCPTGSQESTRRRLRRP